MAGSFVEDIETYARRDPGDIDVITFINEPRDHVALHSALLAASPRIFDRKYIKATYHVDSFIVSLGSDPPLIVDNSRYWFGLFTHRRDEIWKGILTVDLLDATDDAAAIATLPAPAKLGRAAP